MRDLTRLLAANFAALILVEFLRLGDSFQALAIRLAAKVWLPGTGSLALSMESDRVCIVFAGFV